MKHIKNLKNYLKEATEYHYLNPDDEYPITKVTRDEGHEYKYSDGIIYELSTSGKDIEVWIEEIEHTVENTFYDDQVERYVEYLEDGGILETFPVQVSPLGGAYTLEDMCEYLADTDNFDLLYDLLKNDYEKLFDDIEDAAWDSSSIGIDDNLLGYIRKVSDLDEHYGKEYKEEYDNEEYKNEDGELYWDETYYNGFKAILKYWEDSEEYTLTDMNHRFMAIKQLGKTKVIVDPS